jgi:hypothetical protein
LVLLMAVAEGKIRGKAGQPLIPVDWSQARRRATNTAAGRFF